MVTAMIIHSGAQRYRSHLWKQTCEELGIAPKRTRPYRPQTNGIIERFHRALVEGWEFKKFYSSESARLAALPAWIHQYNHLRPHSAIGRAAPISRLNNVPGHHRDTVHGRQARRHLIHVGHCWASRTRRRTPRRPPRSATR